jgi:DNA-binding NarL/FixJ family response regulator
MTIRLAVGEDSLIVREGLRQLLGADPRLEVVAVVGDIDSLSDACDTERPDVVITDIRMPPTHTDEGLRAAHAIRTRHPRMPIVILSQHVDAGIAMRLLVEDPVGLGYLLKDRVIDLDEFMSTLRHVVAGGSALDPKVVAELLGGKRDDRSLDGLGEREHEILALIAEGRTNKGVGDRLGLSQSAVRKHVSSIFTKLDLPATDDDHRRILAVLAYLRPRAETQRFSRPTD